jgi:hypothetical protein
MGRRFGLLMLLVACGAGCQDQEKTAVVRPGETGGAGGTPSGSGLGRGGSPAPALIDASDAGGPVDTSAAVDMGSTIDVSVPDVISNMPEMPVNPLGNYAGKPWNGMVLPIPGIIQAELFDVGGEGVAFHDTDTVNHGNGMMNMSMSSPQAMFRRAEAVDVSFTMATDKDPMGKVEELNQLYVGWIERQEWLKYTVSVAETGNYMISSHVAVNNENSTISFSFEDGVATPPLPLPRSGSFFIWQHVDNMAIIKLNAGLHVLTIKFDTTGYNLNYISFIRKD